MNNADTVLLAKNVYDEFGRLKSSKANNIAKLETGYKYNIRSWVSNIDNTNFKEKLTYTYSGNIATMLWGKTTPLACHYSFTYDNLSQLKTASYSNSLARGLESYSTAYTCDKHGNIKTIKRYGIVS